MTLRKQLLLLLVAFSVIPAIALTAARLNLNVRTIESLHLDRLSAITQISAAAFNEIMSLRKDEVVLLASSWNMRDYLKMKERGAPEAELGPAMSRLVEYVKVYIDTLHTFDDLILMDETGRVVLGYKPDSVGRDFSAEDYFKQVKDVKEENYVFSSKAHPALINIGKPDGKCLALSMALRSADGRLLGVLAAFVDVNLLAGFSKSISFGNTGVAFVIDSDNYILYHPEPRFYNSYTAAPGLINLLDRWKNGQIPPIGLIDDVMDGKRRIYYYEVMPKIGLILILRQDYEEFTADSATAVQFAVVSCLLTTALALIFALVFSRKFTAPILALKKAFASGGEEELYVSVDLPLKNELGDMAACYNEMIGRLERQYAQIKHEKDKNEHNALHDGITGLFNREALERTAQQHMADEKPMGIFYVDIDNFKKINYVRGHVVGDELLRAIGRRLENSRGAFDVCARIGGDEFVLAKKGGVVEARRAAEILIEEMRAPVVAGDSSFFITVSVGIAMYPEHGRTTDTLIANADIAMFKAKENGKNLFAVYDGQMRGRLDRHNAIMDVLRNCIEEREVFFMHQPVFDFADGKVLGFETLMRVKSARLGLISPVEFIPVAESDKLVMLKLGDLAIRSACSFAGKLIAEKGFGGYVAVNISSVQLNADDFVDNVLGAVKEAAIPPSSLQLEITESVMSAARLECCAKLQAVREAGVRVAMDNFGSRNSSFHQFINLPIDVLKIDRKFFQAAASCERTELMNKTIIELARGFGLGIVGECVESATDRELLRQAGCEVVQGFVYSKPLMEEKAAALLDAT